MIVGGLDQFKQLIPSVQQKLNGMTENSVPNDKFSNVLNQSIGNLNQSAGNLNNKDNLNFSSNLNINSDGSFVDSMGSFVKEVDSLHKEAGDMNERMLKGEPVELHDVMIAAEKSKTAFQLLVEIRNKFLDVYREVSRLQV